MNADGMYAEPVTRLSFQQARQRFLGLVRQHPSDEPKIAKDDIDMLVPDGRLAFYVVFFSVCLIET